MRTANFLTDKAFDIFVAICGAIVVAIVVFVGGDGAAKVIEIARSESRDVSALGPPVGKVVVSIVLMGGFFYAMIARTRVRRTLQNIFSIPELVKKIAFTVALLAIYRVGFWIVIPGLDQAAMFRAFETQGGGALGDVLETVALFTGGNLKQSTIFGLGIMPYITASIIFQLLGTVVPAIERLQREGEAGRKKIQEYTRYATVGLCLIQASVWVIGQSRFYPGFEGPLYRIMGILSMTTGTVFLMWLGEQIDEYGIGNGISLLIMGGIVARMPEAIVSLLQRASLSLAPEQGDLGLLKIIGLVVMFVGVVAGAILITQGQRRIPIQQAKMTRGRRVYGGQRQYLPLRVNHGGVMPIIFTSALMMFPGVIFGAIRTRWANPVTNFLVDSFQMNEYLYWLCYIGMVFFFAFFWTTVQFKPKEMSDQLRDSGSFIPGLRPGRRTAEYLEKVMERITYCGAAFLALIAVIPMVVAVWMEIPYSISAFLGGTGLLITVSVTLDLVQRIEAQLVMRNYGGFLGENIRIKGPR